MTLGGVWVVSFSSGLQCNVAKYCLPIPWIPHVLIIFSSTSSAQIRSCTFWCFEKSRPQVLDYNIVNIGRVLQCAGLCIRSISRMHDVRMALPRLGFLTDLRHTHFLSVSYRDLLPQSIKLCRMKNNTVTGAAGWRSVRTVNPHGQKQNTFWNVRKCRRVCLRLRSVDFSLFCVSFAPLMGEGGNTHVWVGNCVRRCGKSY